MTKKEIRILKGVKENPQYHPEHKALCIKKYKDIKKGEEVTLLIDEIFDDGVFFFINEKYCFNFFEESIGEWKFNEHFKRIS